jgi:hypothetical protein
MSGIEDWLERERGLGRDRERQCREKRVFAGEAEARAVAAADRAQFGDRFYPYRCDLCGDWHLTRQPPAEG